METATYFIKRQSEEDIKVEKKANNKGTKITIIDFIYSLEKLE
jgi:hypothetical protein